MQSTYRYLFGPVPSRRFGRLLGVDLAPFKTCCYDRVFCQLGRTTNHTIRRREYVPTERVIEELKHSEHSGQASFRVFRCAVVQGMHVSTEAHVSTAGGNHRRIQYISPREGTGQPRYDYGNVAATALYGKADCRWIWHASQ